MIPLSVRKVCSLWNISSLSLITESKLIIKFSNLTPNSSCSLFILAISELRMLSFSLISSFFSTTLLYSARPFSSCIRIMDTFSVRWSMYFSMEDISESSYFLSYLLSFLESVWYFFSGMEKIDWGVFYFFPKIKSNICLNYITLFFLSIIYHPYFIKIFLIHHPKFSFTPSRPSNI